MIIVANVYEKKDGHITWKPTMADVCCDEAETAFKAGAIQISTPHPSDKKWHLTICTQKGNPWSMFCISYCPFCGAPSNVVEAFLKGIDIDDKEDDQKMNLDFMWIWPLVSLGGLGFFVLMFYICEKVDGTR